MTTATPSAPGRDPELERLTRLEHTNPHGVLGVHPDGDGRWVLRGWRPEATAMTAVLADGRTVELAKVHDAGVFAGTVTSTEVPEYHYRVIYGDGQTCDVGDPYRFWPTVGDLDLHLFNEGRHHQLWRMLGARHRQHQGTWGTSFAGWAPSAKAVRVVGDFNGWDGRLHPMRSMGSSGVWEVFVPDVAPGARYKFELLTEAGHLRLKADPMAFATEAPPGTNSVVAASTYEWQDDEWLARRAATDQMNRPMSVYEVHLGSWRTVPEEGERPLTYRELAHLLEGLRHQRADLVGVGPGVVEVRGLAREGTVDEPKAEQHGGERLADLVVQVPGDPGSLGLLGVDDPGEHLPLSSGVCLSRGEPPLGAY